MFADIAELFNTYFSNTGENLAAKISSSNVDPVCYLKLGDQTEISLSGRCS